MSKLDDGVAAILHPELAKRPKANVVCMADVKAEPLRWLWCPRLALGKLSIIAGDPGLGKSMLTASLAAHVSTGRKWPDGSPCPDGSVVLVSGEDDPSDTIRPRLDAAGAKVERIHYLRSIRDPERGERGFTLADVGPLGELLSDLGDCVMVIVDPLSAYLGGTDSHKNADIRALLTPLSAMAASHGVAIVAVTHLNKSQGAAMYRLTGSLAFVAAARAAFAVVRDKDDDTRRLLLPVKNNLGDDRTGMAYRIREDKGVPYVQWEREPVRVDIEAAMSPDTRQDSGSAKDDAVEFLADLLASGPVPTDDVKGHAKAAGLSWSTVRRAKDTAGVRSVRHGFGAEGKWCWTLPKVLTSPNDAHVPDVGTYGTNEHLSAETEADHLLAIVDGGAA